MTVRLLLGLILLSSCYNSGFIVLLLILTVLLMENLNLRGGVGIYWFVVCAIAILIGVDLSVICTHLGNFVQIILDGGLWDTLFIGR